MPITRKKFDECKKKTWMDIGEEIFNFLNDHHFTAYTKEEIAIELGYNLKDKDSPGSDKIFQKSLQALNRERRVQKCKVDGKIYYIIHERIHL
jgi:hypothetical protein